MSKFIFVTGGVASSVGKGITVASLGRLLKNRGISVSLMKLDPYINVDPGTMSPYQHGEVFVTDDGAETDLDLGHYERFTDEPAYQSNNVTTGQVYAAVIGKERRGEYLGGTIQVIPHITNEIKDRIHSVARHADTDVVIVEVGGTVGDIEGEPFLQKWFALDIAHRSAHLHDHHIRVGMSRHAVDAILNLVGDMRDYLDSPAQILAASLFPNHRRVHLPRRHIVALIGRFIRKPLVVAQVEIGLRAIVGHEHLAMLIRRHCSRINIDVGVQLHEGDTDAPILE